VRQWSPPFGCCCISTTDGSVQSGYGDSTEADAV
jgi:hypothetical protein